MTKCHRKAVTATYSLRDKGDTRISPVKKPSERRKRRNQGGKWDF